MVRQYYGDDEADNPPVVQELPYDVERTFVDGFTVNTEAHGNAWKHFRITTTSEIISVLSKTILIMPARSPAMIQSGFIRYTSWRFSTKMLRNAGLDTNEAAI